MKKMLFITCFTLCLFAFEKTGVYAQAPQGRPAGENQPFIGPPRDTINYGEPEKIVIEKFPDIPYLSSYQRENIETVLLKEREAIDRQIQKKRRLIKNDKEQSASGNKKDEQKIKKLTKKSNRKIKKLLVREQYRAFLKKRGEFQFQKVTST